MLSFPTLLKLHRTNWIPAREVDGREIYHLHLNLTSSLFFFPHLPVRCSKILSIVKGLERIPDICVALKVVYYVPNSVCVCVCVCVYMLCCFSHFKLYVTLWTIAHQALLSMGFSRQEYWGGGRLLEWVTIPLSRRSSWPRDRTHISNVSCIDRQVLYHGTTWEAHIPNSTIL